MMTPDGLQLLAVFLALFAVFAVIGFLGRYYRRADLSQLHEWGLAGRKLGTALQFFLQGADLFTAYAILAIPSAVFALGAFGFFGVACEAMVLAFVSLYMPRLWRLSRDKGYITIADYARGEFNSTLLSLTIVILGIFATLFYIALQVDGLYTILGTLMLKAFQISPTSPAFKEYSVVMLFVTFAIIAAFSFTSGIRGVSLGAIFKDVLVWTGLLTVIVVTLAALKGFSNLFAGMPSYYLSLPSAKALAFTSSMLGMVFSAYLWPHNITGSWAAQSEEKLLKGYALTVLYAIPLALADVLAIAVYKLPTVYSFIKPLPPDSRGLYVIPALLVSLVPGWLAGIALLGIFVGGLVPAALMAVTVGNMTGRDLARIVKPGISPRGQTTIAKWAAVAFAFLSLALLQVIPMTYAFQFYLVGAEIVLQFLPIVVIHPFFRFIRKELAIAGIWVGSIVSILLTLYANHFGTIKTTLYHDIYTGFFGLAVNLVIVFLSLAFPKGQ
ncbi:sodium:solute symporter family protein [Acidilobus sp.]|uniref:sodium:solute symporter family protein n=1 Tax=Acidilobus sp. TaxID=1872109 RepID=UPI003D071C39